MGWARVDSVTRFRRILPIRCVSLSQSHRSDSYGRTVLFNDIYVGCLTCKFEDASASSTRLYIATLGILAPYRHQGLATRLIDNLIDKAKQTHSLNPLPLFDGIPISTKSLSAKDKKAADGVIKSSSSAAAAVTTKVTGLYLHVREF